MNQQTTNKKYLALGFVVIWQLTIVIMFKVYYFSRMIAENTENNKNQK